MPGLLLVIPPTWLLPKLISHSSAISAPEKGWKLQHGPLVETRLGKVLHFVIVRSSAIIKCVKGVLLLHALGLLMVLRHSAVLPYVISVSAAISAWGLNTQWLHAFGPLSEMGHWECLASASDYSFAIRVCGKDGQCHRALWLLGERRLA